MDGRQERHTHARTHVHYTAHRAQHTHTGQTDRHHRRTDTDRFPRLALRLPAVATGRGAAVAQGVDKLLGGHHGLRVGGKPGCKHLLNRLFESLRGYIGIRITRCLQQRIKQTQSSSLVLSGPMRHANAQPAGQSVSQCFHVIYLTVASLFCRALSIACKSCFDSLSSSERSLPPTRVHTHRRATHKAHKRKRGASKTQRHHCMPIEKPRKKTVRSGCHNTQKKQIQQRAPSFASSSSSSLRYCSMNASYFSRSAAPGGKEQEQDQIHAGSMLAVSGSARNTPQKPVLRKWHVHADVPTHRPWD